MLFKKTKKKQKYVPFNVTFNHKIPSLFHRWGFSTMEKQMKTKK